MVIVTPFEDDAGDACKPTRGVIGGCVVDFTSIIDKHSITGIWHRVSPSLNRRMRRVASMATTVVRYSIVKEENASF
jgi:hypothetical protein